MSDSAQKNLSILWIVLGIISIGFSIYASYAWMQMYENALECGSTYLAHKPGQTLYPCHTETLFGDGWVGVLAPTVFAVLGVLSFIEGYRGLTARST